MNIKKSVDKEFKSGISLFWNWHDAMTAHLTNKGDRNANKIKIQKNRPKRKR